MQTGQKIENDIFSPKKAPAGRCRQDKEFQARVFGRIFYEWGPGESVWALDQDVDNYIDWLWEFIRRKNICVCSGVVENHNKRESAIYIYIYIYIDIWQFLFCCGAWLPSGVHRVGHIWGFRPTRRVGGHRRVGGIRGFRPTFVAL